MLPFRSCSTPCWPLLPNNDEALGRSTSIVRFDVGLVVFVPTSPSMLFSPFCSTPVTHLLGQQMEQGKHSDRGLWCTLCFALYVFSKHLNLEFSWGCQQQGVFFFLFVWAVVPGLQTFLFSNPHVHTAGVYFIYFHVIVFFLCGFFVTLHLQLLTQGVLLNLCGLKSFRGFNYSFNKWVNLVVFWLL